MSSSGSFAMIALKSLAGTTNSQIPSVLTLMTVSVVMFVSVEVSFILLSSALIRIPSNIFDVVLTGTE